MDDLDHTDALAAEYVLGTLDSDERAQARASLDSDPAFAAKVLLWERRLGELHLMVEPVEPETKIWTRIKGRMAEVQARANDRLPEAPVLQPVPVVTPAEPPSLDAIEAAISQTATALTSDAAMPPAAAPEAGPTSEADPALAAEPAPAVEAPPAEMVPEPSADASPPATEAAPTSAAPPIHEATSISQATPLSEATLIFEATPTPDSVAAPIADVAPSAEATAVPASEPAAPHAVEPWSVPPVIPPPPPAAAPILTPDARPVPPPVERREVVVTRRRLRRWRALALLMMLVVVAVAALLAAWRWAPDRVPPMLRPAELMRHVGIALPAGPPAPAPRRPVPPPSPYQE